uniref:Uncharacterized protein n=1 Tax=Mimivirus LCMiAC01 TaxID=2506608 RepID=A0A481Z107_9VIRU|nr:MAG: uncharacterized protein LCMiAC01_00300 [Mimivirus LCMiAC01]
MNFRANNNKVRRNEINGENMYQSRNLGLHRRFVRSKSNERYRKSEHVMETGIIPNYYNRHRNVKMYKKEAEYQGYIKSSLQSSKQGIEHFDDDSVFSDMSTIASCRSGCSSVGGDPTAFYKRSLRFNDNKKFERKIDEEHGPGFLSQFRKPRFDNPSGPVSRNNVSAQIGGSDIRKIELERKIALDGEYSKFSKNEDMTYGIVKKENFVHNNMVPNFKRGIGKGYGPNSRMQEQLNSINQRKMDRFSGSIKNIEYRPKTERKPLFNPHVGLTWIYGMPNFTDYYENRFIPGRERRNEKLHQPVRITPGLNLGYNEISKQGFHDRYRTLPKDVDALRTANNPKITYGRPIIPGMKGDRRSIVGSMMKRRPERWREYDPRDLLTQKGGSYFKGPAIYGNFSVPHTNRQQTTKAWGGPAFFANKSVHTQQSLYPKVKISHKENFHMDVPRNITGHEYQKNTSLTANTYYAKPTHRQLTQKKTYLHNPKLHEGFKGGYQAQHGGTIAKPTLRQLTQKVTHLRNHQLHEGFKGGYHAQQAGTIAQPTLRQLTQNVTHLRNHRLHEGQKGGYHAQQAGTIARPTLRQLTQNVTHLRNHRLHEGQKGGYHAQQAGTIAPQTLRQLTQNVTYLRNHKLHEGQKGGYHAQQAGTIAPPTLRQLTQNVTHLRNHRLHEGQKGGYHAQQAGTIAKPTLRQLTQNVTHLRNHSLHEGQKGGYHAAQAGTIAPATIRQQTQNVTQLNQPILHEGFKGGYHAAQAGTIAPATIRQQTQNTSQLNHPTLHEGQKGGYHAAQAGTFAPATIRQQTQNTAQLNPAAHHQGQRGGYHAAQAGTFAPATIRQQTQNTAQLNPAAQHEGQKGGYHAAQAGTIAPATIRQQTQNTAQLNPAIHHEGQKQRRRADARNSLINISKDMVTVKRDGGYPTTSNYDKGPTYEHTMVQLCDPIQVNRDIYGGMYGQRPLQCIPTMYTRQSNILPQHSWRFDTCVTESLKTNPFINNTQMKAVRY